MTALPTMAELGPMSDGAVRQIEDLLALVLIPRDEPKLRAAAVELLQAEALECSTTSEDHHKRAEAARDCLSSVQAQTPGGLAWKLWLAGRSHLPGPSDSGWRWCDYLLESAIRDAIELERRRQAEKATAA